VRRDLRLRHHLRHGDPSSGNRTEVRKRTGV